MKSCLSLSSQCLATKSKCVSRPDILKLTELLSRLILSLNITADLGRLPALSGVIFGRQDSYLAGMWRHILLESLHWAAMPQGKREMAQRPVQYRAPSWSWMSIEAPIRHVEVDVHKTIHSPKLDAKVIGASCSPEGLDLRGQVSSAYIRIQRSLLDVQVVALPD